MNARQRRALERQQQTAATEPLKAVAPKAERPFKARTLPLDGGFDVRITGTDAVEQDIHIVYESNRITILTGDAARAAKTGQFVAPVMPERVAVTRPTTNPSPVVATRTNESVFLAKAQATGIDLDAPFEYPELVDPPAAKPLGRVGPNGELLPRSPIDRTGAQRAALAGNVTVSTSMGDVPVNTGLTLESVATGG